MLSSKCLTELSGLWTTTGDAISLICGWMEEASGPIWHSFLNTLFPQTSSCPLKSNQSMRHSPDVYNQREEEEPTLVGCMVHRPANFITQSFWANDRSIHDNPRLKHARFDIAPESCPHSLKSSIAHLLDGDQNHCRKPSWH